MAHSLGEPALADFLTELMDHPLAFGAGQEAAPFLGASQPLQQPQPPLPEQPGVLSACSFTDVLATVASDWHGGTDPSQAWGASFLDLWPGEQPRGGQPGPAAFTAAAIPCVPSQADCSSNNSGDAAHAPLKQEDALPLAAAAPPASDSNAASDGEPPAPKSHAGGGRQARETPSARAEQRRTRKREKDRIEELQAAIAKQGEEMGQLRAQADELARRLQEKDEELRKLRAVEEAALPAADDDQLAASFEGTLRLTVEGEGREVVLTAEQIRSLSREDISRLWAQYVARLRHLLPAARQPGPEQADSLALVGNLQREAVILLIRCAIVNAPVTKGLYAGGRADSSEPGSPPPHFWQQVAAELQLSPEQRARTAELWRSFAERIGRLMAVRRSIHDHMAATIPDGVFGRSFAINFLKAHELMDALKYNLRQEHIVLCDLAAAFHRLLGPAQNAGCMVASWPFWPNVPRISALVAQSAGPQQ